MRQFKKITVILSIVLSMALASVAPVKAAELQVLTFGRIIATMPVITAELKGQGFNNTEITARLGSEALQIEDVITYSKQCTTKAYILVDLSGSVEGYFDTIKKSIKSYVNSMGVNDEIVILTFGETEVVSLLEGTESKEEICRKVDALECDENGTLFYEALNQAYQLSNSKNSEFDREYVLAFSDGVDVQKGSATFDETKKMYATHTLPIYAACTANSTKAGADSFGKLARLSGGSIVMMGADEDFKKLEKEINNITLVRMRSNSRVADGTKKQLSLKAGDLQAECSIPVTRAIEDNEKPTVENVKYSKKDNVFTIDFSEPVAGADVISAYEITNEKNKKIEVVSVQMLSNDARAEVRVEEGIVNGEYAITFHNITDKSLEKNFLDEKIELSIEGIKNDEQGMETWLIILIVGLIVLMLGSIVTAVVIVTRRKEQQEEIQQRSQERIYRHMEVEAPAPIVEKCHIKAENVARIRLRVKTGRTSEQNIEMNIVSSLIVGRSDTCDIYIDDPKLSRQHFVIEHDDSDFYVMDLQSRNGTMLNGIRVGSRQVLRSGDKIVAGLSDIYITILE